MTIIRWDQEKRALNLYTAYPADAKKWERLGYPVETCGRTQAGGPRSWQAKAPLEPPRLLKLVEGKVVMHRRGRSFPLAQRKLAGAGHRSGPDGKSARAG